MNDLKAVLCGLRFKKHTKNLNRSFILSENAYNKLDCKTYLNAINDCQKNIVGTMPMGFAVKGEDL